MKKRTIAQAVKMKGVKFRATSEQIEQAFQLFEGRRVNVNGTTYWGEDCSINSNGYGLWIGTQDVWLYALSERDFKDISSKEIKLITEEESAARLKAKVKTEIELEKKDWLPALCWVSGYKVNTKKNIAYVVDIAKHREGDGFAFVTKHNGLWRNATPLSDEELAQYGLCKLPKN